MQINTSTPRATQNFGASTFYNIPVDMQQAMKANKTFRKISEAQDILVVARPRASWRDPFGFRTPKADEKCYLGYQIKDLDVPFSSRVNAIATESKLVAPLRAHVNTLLEKLEIERIIRDLF